MIGQWTFDSAAWQAGQPYPAHWQNFYFPGADHGVLHATITGIPCDTGADYFYTANGGQTWAFTPLPMTPTGYFTESGAYARIGNNHIIMAGRVGCGVQSHSVALPSSSLCCAMRKATGRRARVRALPINPATSPWSTIPPGS